jgi:hypothetical protein
MLYQLWTLIAKIRLQETVFRIFYLEISKEFSARTKNLCSSRYVLHVRDVKEASEVIFSWSIGSRNIGLNRGSKWYLSGTTGSTKFGATRATILPILPILPIFFILDEMTGSTDSTSL